MIQNATSLQQQKLPSSNETETTETTAFSWQDDWVSGTSFEKEQQSESDREATVKADMEEIAFRAKEIFAAQRKAREAFFRNVYEHTAWRWMKLEKMDLAGAAASADLDSRRFHAFVRMSFAMALESEQIGEGDLPGRDEIYEYYWLFVYQNEWQWAEQDAEEDSIAGEQHRPTTRSHAKALKKCVQDCNSSSDRVQRFRSMQGNITGLDANSPLTARMINRIGSALVEKRDPFEFKRRPKQWRDLETHRPAQSKANDALDQLQLALSNGNLPDEASNAIRAALGVFSDDRQVLLALDAEQNVVGALARQRHYYGFMEQKRGKGRGPRGGRSSYATPIHIFQLKPDWSVVPVDEELMEWADNYKAFKDAVKCVPPPARQDDVLMNTLVVMPNEAQALEHVDHAGELGFRLVPVPLQTLKKWIARGKDILGRHWEDVADEVYEVIDIHKVLVENPIVITAEEA